jgi:hypothetical protein
VQAFTKRPLLVVLAVLILLDILAVQTVLSRDKKDPATPRAASASRTPGVVPVTVTPPSLVVPAEPASPNATTTPDPQDTSTPSPTTTPEDIPTPEATPTTKDEDPPDPVATGPQIQIKGPSFAGRPFETVPMEGTYTGSAPRTLLRVQQRQDGAWVDFPLPTATDENGNFSVHVEFGTTGEHQIRVVDPKAGTVSDTTIVVIR